MDFQAPTPFDIAGILNCVQAFDGWYGDMDYLGWNFAFKGISQSIWG